jgi:sugar lactone lactonase YvrE
MIRRIVARKIRCARLLSLLTVVMVSLQAACAQVTFTGSQVGLASGMWTAPNGVTVDSKGNLWIADRGNNRLVELSASSGGFSAPVTILSGLSGPSGVAVDWSGNVFLADTGNDRILMLPVATGGFGAAVTLAGGLNTPVGVAVDSADNLYIADSGNNRIVELPLAGGVYGVPVVVSTGFNNPMGVAVDANRNLFIADTGNDRVVKEVFTAGGYPSQQSFWNNSMTPVGISVDKNDNLYIADTMNKRVVEEPWFAAAGRFSNLIVIGSGFASPAGSAVDSSGNIYVTDSVNNQVVEVVTGSVDFGAVNIGSSGAMLTYNFNVAAGTALGGIEIYTQGVSGKDFVDAGGSTCLAQAYLFSTYCGVNVKFTPLASGTRMGAVDLSDPNGNPLATAFISGMGNEPQIAVIPGTVTVLGTQLSGPAGVGVDGGGNVYIADTGDNRVVELPWTGSGYGPQTTLPVPGLINPMGLAVDAAGNLYIVSNGNDKVVKLPWTANGFGQPAKVGSGLNGPSNVAVDINGNLYLTDTLDERVDELPWTGSGYSAQLELGSYHKAPIGIAVDGSGDVYFTDPYQDSISEVPWSGTRYLPEIDLSPVQASFPSALAVDGNSNLYILDTDNNRVIMLPRIGSGFGKQITVASGFNAPTGIALSGNGQLFIADTGNNRVVKIDLSAPSAMRFTNAYLGSSSADGVHVAQVENVGNQPLVLSSVNYPADFPEGSAVTGACVDNATLGPSQSCELAVNFTPLAVGSPLTESVSVTSNSLGITGSQLSLPVTGTSFSKVAQTINFPPIPGIAYRYAAIALSATASSGLPVTFTVVSGPGVLVSGGQWLRVTGVGTVVIAATQAGNSTYGSASVDVSVTVAPAVLTVTPQDTTVVYGSIPTSFQYSIVGFANGESASATVTGKPVIAGNASNTSGAGSYVLTASQGTLSAANYIFAFAPGTLTVNKAKIAVVAYSVVHNYGAPINTLMWYLSGFVNGESPSVVTGAPVLTTAANSGAPVGSYPIVVSVGTLTAANYSFVSSNGLFTVEPAMLTVAAASQTITYGGTIPALTYWISGFVNGDTGTSVVHGAPGISTAAGSGSAAGKYTISTSVGTLTSANYVFRFSSGVLTIGKAVLQVSPANVAMTYGGKVPALTYSLSGFVNGDTSATAMSGTPALSTPANASSRPGSYLIASGPGTLAASNYNFSYGKGTVTIGKAVLTVTAKSLSMTYGAPLPALTYSYSGFLNGDGSTTVQGALSLSTGATSASPVGSYPIVCTAGTLTSQEYTFNVVNGTLTINQAVIAVKAASFTMTYGAIPPSLSYQLSGFVNGDTAAAVSGAPLINSSVAATSPAGFYPVAVAVGSLSATNYTFSPVPGAITVKKALLMVIASSLTTTYGSSLPALTYTLTGFANGDSQQTATSGVPQMSTTPTATSAVGSYSIVPALGSLSAQNYTFGFAQGTMKVNKAILTVNANNLAMQVGGAVPTLTYSTSGWVNGDTQATAMTGAPALTTSANTTSKAGSYTIVAAQGSMNANNYQFTLVNGTLVVNQSSANLLRTFIR